MNQFNQIKALEGGEELSDNNGSIIICYNMGILYIRSGV
jgi:hypothetical protein